jgi:hypothetical protein
VVLGVRF